MNIRHALSAFTLLVFTICTGAAHAAEEFKGSWSILPSKEPGKVQFGLMYRTHDSHSQHQSDWPVSAFQGLDLAPGAKRDVAFTISRDAGRFDCEGYLRNGEGAGTFRFMANAGFAKAMEDIGFPVEDDIGHYAMAVHDVTTAFAREMQAEKLENLDTDKLLALRIFDVTAQFIRELRAEGLPARDANKLIAFRVHGVTPAIVKDTRGAGLEVSEDMLIAFRVHGVSPEYIATVERLGLGRPDANQLVAMRVHGVTPEFISEMKSRGLRNLTVDQLINLRVHGIE